MACPPRPLSPAEIQMRVLGSIDMRHLPRLKPRRLKWSSPELVRTTEEQRLSQNPFIFAWFVVSIALPFALSTLRPRERLLAWAATGHWRERLRHQKKGQ
jgi:hypothetical protein